MTSADANIQTIRARAFKLLFQLIQNSFTMYKQFHDFTLNDPGVETLVIHDCHGMKSKRSENNENYMDNGLKVPLTYGYCLLARLLKHPNFEWNGKEALEIYQVWSYQIFTK